MVGVISGHPFHSGLCNTANFVDLLQVPWKGLCLKCQGHENRFKSLLCPQLDSMEVEKLPGVTGITVNPCVLEQIYTRGVQQGLLHRGAQIYPQGHSI